MFSISLMSGCQLSGRTWITPSLLDIGEHCDRHCHIILCSCMLIQLAYLCEFPYHWLPAHWLLDRAIKQVVLKQLDWVYGIFIPCFVVTFCAIDGLWDTAIQQFVIQSGGGCPMNFQPTWGMLVHKNMHYIQWCFLFVCLSSEKECHERFEMKSFPFSAVSLWNHSLFPTNSHVGEGLKNRHMTICTYRPTECQCAVRLLSIPCSCTHFRFPSFSHRAACFITQEPLTSTPARMRHVLFILLRMHVCSDKVAGLPLWGFTSSQNHSHPHFYAQKKDLKCFGALDR